MKNQTERKTLRLHHYDYSANGSYFITACTFEKNNIFGRIEDGNMHLCLLGKIAEEEIRNINIKRADQFINISKFIVMPNHVHMIINIFKPDLYREYQVEQFSKPTSQSVSSIVRSYKSAVSKRIHELPEDFNIPYKIWQPRFYDNIIRNEKAFQKIWEYIDTNPLRWDKDEFYNDTVL